MRPTRSRGPRSSKPPRSASKSSPRRWEPDRVDLHLIDAAPTPEERAAIDLVLGPATSGWEGGERRPELDGHVAYGGSEQARSQRHLLLPALHAVSDRVGWISRGALGYVSQRLSIPPAEAYGVASFYAMLSMEERPRTVVHVCDDIACRANGAEALCVAMERADLGPEAGWVRSPCLGLCESAPAALIQRNGSEGGDPWPAVGRATVETVRDSLTTNPSPPDTFVKRHVAPSLLRRVGKVDPTSLDEYRAHGGYAALRTAVGLGSEGVIREVKDSKLLGRGGAAFPTGLKWEAVAKQPVRPHYFIRNADEPE